MAVQDAQPTVVLAGFDQVEFGLHPFAHDLGGDALGAIAWFDVDRARRVRCWSSSLAAHPSGE